MRLWLLGSGIAGSPSPAMQNAALAARGLSGGYEIRDSVEAELPELLERMRGGAVQGANVTIPFKVSAAGLCDRLEGDAGLLGAVNTLVVESGSLIGANTDVGGFELALRHQGLWPQPGVRAVVLGSGGSAAAVTLALGRVPEVEVTVVARSAGVGCGWGERLAAVLPLRFSGWSEAEAGPRLRDADLVVNATPAGLAGMPFDVQALAPEATVVDLRYRPRPVDLVAAARSRGLRAADGLEMLLQQGMLSFTRWTGQPPPFEEARAALLEAVAG